MADTHHSDALLAIGEVHTALLRSSAALSMAASEKLVSLAGGERVRRFERPISHVVSPLVLTGVDCRPATANGAKARVVGTVAGYASITGGHVVQGTAATRIAASRSTRRLGWAYYLARPGWVELIGRAPVDELALGFLGPPAEPDMLDLGAIGARLIGDVQTAPVLDGRLPFRVERTRLRWVVRASASEPAARFRIAHDGLRTLAIEGAVEFDAAAEFAADFALHDWLLSALIRIVDRSRVGIDDRASVVQRLRPAVEHLLHLWMPAARGDEAAAALWTGLERRPGLARQWDALVNRVRDQLALGAIAALSDRLGETVP
jgi:hypothetical protein